MLNNATKIVELIIVDCSLDSPKCQVFKEFFKSEKFNIRLLDLQNNPI